MLSQPAFNWKAPESYVKLLKFEMEVANVLQAKAYDLNEEEKVSAIRNLLGREELQCIQTHWSKERGMQKVLQECLAS